MKRFNTREEWLIEALRMVGTLFDSRGYKIPPCSVSVGWPSIKGTAAKSRRIGECWDKSTAGDKRFAIFISPVLGSDVDSECDVLEVLVHEAVHAAVGLECGHKGAFKQCAAKVGLVGKMTATTAGPELVEVMEEWAKELGEYPHGVINPSSDKSDKPKKQGTRMIKCECRECGYVARTTKKWIEDVGAPHCPAHGEMHVELPDSEDVDTDPDEN